MDGIVINQKKKAESLFWQFQFMMIKEIFLFKYKFETHGLMKIN